MSTQLPLQDSQLCRKQLLYLLSWRRRLDKLTKNAWGNRGMGAYNASKHAVVGWTRSMDHLPDICNVRVNAVCPYWVGKKLINDTKYLSFFLF